MPNPLVIKGHRFSSQNEAERFFYAMRDKNLVSGGDIKGSTEFDFLEDLYVRYCQATNWPLPNDVDQLIAVIDQTGQGNQSFISQRNASVSTARSSQDGTNNTSKIYQTAFINSISVEQIGESNDVVANQSLGSNGNVLQVGNNNSAELNQNSGTYVSTNIERNGSHNDAVVN